jgi:hypothetical protein
VNIRRQLPDRKGQLTPHIMKTKTARILALALFLAGSGVIFSRCPPNVRAHAVDAR